MIPNHPAFLEAIQEKRKVKVRFYSKPDSGVVDRICAPLEYGLGAANTDGLNRYWFWDFAAPSGQQTLGLVPPQIVELHVLTETFDPALLSAGAPSVPPAPPTPVTGVAPAGPPPHAVPLANA